MEQIFINDTLRLSVPDSFHTIPKEELRALRTGFSGKSIALRSEEKHIILSIGWKKAEGLGALFGKLLVGDDLVRQLENCYSRGQQGYETKAYPEYTIGGIHAGGLRYTYTAKDIDMTGESYAFKKDKTVYYIHFYYRTDRQDESLEECRAILDSASWK